MSKIYYCKTRKDTDINIGKINPNINNKYYSNSKIIGHSPFHRHEAKTKDSSSIEEEKKKFLNLRNIININNNKVNNIKDKTISLFKNRKNLLGKYISYEKINYKNINSKSIFRMKNKNNQYISNKNIILNNIKKSKIFNSNNKYNADFSPKKKIDAYNNKSQIINKGFPIIFEKGNALNYYYSNYIHNQKITDSEKYYKRNNNMKNNKNSNKLKIKNGLRKKIIINKMEKKEKTRNFNLKKNLFNTRTFIVSKKEKRAPKKIQKQSDRIIIKKNILLKMLTNSKTNEFKENESKFLNYELANSDTESTLTNFLYNNNININNQEIIENESPIEDIERKANEIYNSGFRKKNMSYIRFLSKDLDLNNEIEELKDGERIQNILTLSVKLL